MDGDLTLMRTKIEALWATILNPKELSLISNMSPYIVLYTMKNTISDDILLQMENSPE